MRLRQILSLAVLACAVAQARSAEFVYLENTDSGDISVIDIPGHNLVGTIRLGTYLDDVTASHDGRILYANRINSLGPGDSKQIGESGEIIAIDTRTEQILWRTPVHGWCHHLTLSADDRLLYVPLYDTTWMEIVDTKEQRVVNRFNIGLGGHGTKLSPDGKRLYVGSMFLDQLAVFDLATLKPVRKIPFREAVRPFVFGKDEKTAYVQQSRFHGFAVVDLTKSTDEVVREVKLPELSSDVQLPRFYPHTYNHGLALSPDERLLLAAGSVANYVCAFSVPELQLRATIPVGTDPNWIAFSHDGQFAYVSNRQSNDLSVISIAELKEVKRIPVGKYPQRLCTVVTPGRAVAAQ